MASGILCCKSLMVYDLVDTVPNLLYGWGGGGVVHKYI